MSEIQDNLDKFAFEFAHHRNIRDTYLPKVRDTIWDSELDETNVDYLEALWLRQDISLRKRYKSTLERLRPALKKLLDV